MTGCVSYTNSHTPAEFKNFSSPAARYPKMNMMFWIENSAYSEKSAVSRSPAMCL